MGAIHFEELWEKCEQLHSKDSDSAVVVDELMMKLSLYKAIDLQKEVPIEEAQKIKSRTLGEILLTITKISLIDNINVFEALNIAQQYRNLENIAKVPPEYRLPGK